MRKRPNGWILVMELFVCCAPRSGAWAPPHSTARPSALPPGPKQVAPHAHARDLGPRARRPLPLLREPAARSRAECQLTSAMLPRQMLGAGSRSVARVLGGTDTITMQPRRLHAPAPPKHRRPRSTDAHAIRKFEGQRWQARGPIRAPLGSEHLAGSLLQGDPRGGGARAAAVRRGVRYCWWRERGMTKGASRGLKKGTGGCCEGVSVIANLSDSGGRARPARVVA